MKTVIDTNILVSAFIVKNGNPAQILRQINRIELVVSEEILDEKRFFTANIFRKSTR